MVLITSSSTYMDPSDFSHIKCEYWVLRWATIHSTRSLSTNPNHSDDACYPNSPRASLPVYTWYVSNNMWIRSLLITIIEGIQADGYLQSIHLDTARDEFSLRKRFPMYTPAPSHPQPAAPSVSTSYQPLAQMPIATTTSQSTSKPKRKKTANAFILYRSDVLSRGLLPKSVTHQNTASVMIAERWRAETNDVKQKYYDLAAANKRMEDEKYAKDLNIPEAPRKAQRRARKERRAVAIPEPTYSAFSYPQSVPESRPFPQPQLSLPEFFYSNPVQDAASSSSFELAAVSPSSVAESSFPPTPALTVTSMSSESSEEHFTGVCIDYLLH